MMSKNQIKKNQKSPFKASIITLFPDLFPGTLGASVLGRGLKQNLWQLETTNLRNFAFDKHRSVDDTPAGGGAGLVLKPDILASAIDHTLIENDDRPRVLLSPRGKPLTQAMAHGFSKKSGIILVCGRFEGVDQRVIDSRNLQEVSIGDYVLVGGEVAAMVVLESVLRLIPGMLGSSESSKDESFENGLLEYPQYTRPVDFEGKKIPKILTSGDHKKIQQWREQQSLELTKSRRPDLLKKT